MCVCVSVCVSVSVSVSTLSRSLSLSLSLSLSHTLSCSLALPHTNSLSVSYARAHTHTRTSTHTRARIHRQVHLFVGVLLVCSARTYTHKHTGILPDKRASAYLPPPTSMRPPMAPFSSARPNTSNRSSRGYSRL